MKIQLAAFDLDGTLLDNRGQISAANLAAIAKAGAQGIFAVPATGRSFYELPMEVRTAEGVRFFVTSNGAVVTDRQGNPLYNNGIDVALSAKILDSLAAYDVLIELYIDGWPVAEKSKMNAAVFQSFHIHPKYFDVLRDSRKGVNSLRDYFAERRPQVEKFNLFFKDLAQRRTFMEQMAATGTLEVTSSMVNNVEVNKKGSNKGVGLAKLCELLEISPSRVLAMGDSDNDIAMFRFAETAVAVENACDALKQAATHNTVSNEESAVARVFEKFVFLP